MNEFAGESMGDSEFMDSASASDVWARDLIAIIAARLPENVVTCTLRLVNKETASLFKNHTTIKLSQHVPDHYFAQHFSARDPLRPFSRAQRLKLLTLAAASGSLSQIQMLLAAIVRYLTGGDPPANTPARQLWHALQQHGGYDAKSLADLVNSASARGHCELCRWLVASGCPVIPSEAALAAARGGHLGLMEELREGSGREVRPADPITGPDLVIAVAQGCSLAELKRVYKAELRGRSVPKPDGFMESLLTSAAVSPLPDWRDKLSWLKTRCTTRLPPSRLPPGIILGVLSSGLADAVERLAWLRDQGYPLPDSIAMVEAAARAGNLPALRHVLDSLGPATPPRGLMPCTGDAAAEGGHLASLQLLHARGCPINLVSALQGALQRGHLPVVSWLAETFGVGDQQLRGMSWYGVHSCSLPLLRWLHERGCLQPGDNLVVSAVRAGCSEEVLGWLAEQQGRLIQVDLHTLPFFENHVHLANMRCLRRLGWKPSQQDLAYAVRCVAPRPLSGPTLRWLRDQGALPPVTQETMATWARGGGSLCSLKWLAEEGGSPVDWQAALLEARGRRCNDEGVVEWIQNKLLQQRS